MRLAQNAMAQQSNPGTPPGPQGGTPPSPSGQELMGPGGAPGGPVTDHFSPPSQ
jgi:hypothetical protein